MLTTLCWSSRSNMYEQLLEEAKCAEFLLCLLSVGNCSVTAVMMVSVMGITVLRTRQSSMVKKRKLNSCGGPENLVTVSGKVEKAKVKPPWITSATKTSACMVKSLKIAKTTLQNKGFVSKLIKTTIRAFLKI